MSSYFICFNSIPSHFYFSNFLKKLLSTFSLYSCLFHILLFYSISHLFFISILSILPHSTHPSNLHFHLLFITYFFSILSMVLCHYVFFVFVLYFLIYLFILYSLVSITLCFHNFTSFYLFSVFCQWSCWRQRSVTK